MRALRNDSFTVCATDLGPGAICMNDAITATLQPQQPQGLSSRNRPRVALCFGNERRGASLALREAADLRFFIPMTGFVQSINVSVAVALAAAAFLHRTPDYALRASLAHDAMQRSAAFPPRSSELGHEEGTGKFAVRRNSATATQTDLARDDGSADLLSYVAECPSPSPGLACEGMSIERSEEILAGWLLAEVSGSAELLSRAGLRPAEL